MIWVESKEERGKESEEEKFWWFVFRNDTQERWKYNQWNSKVMTEIFQQTETF